MTWNPLLSARRALSAVLVCLAVALLPPSGLAHEVLPAITDMAQDDGRIRFETRLNAEALLSGLDLAETRNTDLSPVAADYDALRAMSAEALSDRFRAFWPDLAAGMTLIAGDTQLQPQFDEITVPQVSDLRQTRYTVIRYSAQLPAGAPSVQFGWAREFGAMALRQTGAEDAYAGYLDPGALSPPVPLSGGGAESAWQTFNHYVPIGINHIVPRGLDHILFVLGLFFFSNRLRPLLAQVSVFTLAHTVTLGAASLGWITLPGAVVEPIIAASIVFVGVENMRARRRHGWRLALVFAFGLLHGLGFAAVLSEFGLPGEGFFAALLGFNLGVEFGQLIVIAMAAAILWVITVNRLADFTRVATLASAGISLVGGYWFVERLIGA